MYASKMYAMAVSGARYKYISTVISRINRKYNDTKQRECHYIHSQKKQNILFHWYIHIQFTCTYTTYHGFHTKMIRGLLHFVMMSNGSSISLVSFRFHFSQVQLDVSLVHNVCSTTILWCTREKIMYILRVECTQQITKTINKCNNGNNNVLHLMHKKL